MGHRIKFKLGLDDNSKHTLTTRPLFIMSKDTIFSCSGFCVRLKTVSRIFFIVAVWLYQLLLYIANPKSMLFKKQYFRLLFHAYVYPTGYFSSFITIENTFCCNNSNLPYFSKKNRLNKTWKNNDSKHIFVLPRGK